MFNMFNYSFLKNQNKMFEELKKAIEEGIKSDEIKQYIYDNITKERDEKSSLYYNHSSLVISDNGAKFKIEFIPSRNDFNKINIVEEINNEFIDAISYEFNEGITIYKRQVEHQDQTMCMKREFISDVLAKECQIWWRNNKFGIFEKSYSMSYYDNDNNMSYKCKLINSRGKEEYKYYKSESCESEFMEISASLMNHSPFKSFEYTDCSEEEYEENISYINEKLSCFAYKM